MPITAASVPLCFGYHPYLRIPDVPREEWQLTTPNMRHLPVDNTGFYECVAPRDDLNSALTLALNQSGKMIVGWFASPPAFVANLADTVSLIGDENKRKMQGVLIADVEDQGPNGIPFLWMKSVTYRPFNELDPDDLP
jgi:hypothetical protein